MSSRLSRCPPTLLSLSLQCTPLPPTHPPTFNIMSCLFSHLISESSFILPVMISNNISYFVFTVISWKLWDFIINSSNQSQVCSFFHVFGSVHVIQPGATSCIISSYSEEYTWYIRHVCVCVCRNSYKIDRWNKTYTINSQCLFILVGEINNGHYGHTGCTTTTLCHEVALIGRAPLRHWMKNEL